MSGCDGARASRREFLAGKGHIEDPAAAAGSAGEVEIPRAGDTLRIQTRAMACQFAVFLDADRREQLDSASRVLEAVHDLEALMTVYRPESPLARANAIVLLPAEGGPVREGETHPAFWMGGAGR